MKDYNLKTELTYLAKPLLIVLIFLALLIGALLTSYNRISSVREEIQQIETTNRILSQKITVLEKVVDVLPGDITFIDIALPSRTPVLYGISQIKLQAARNGVSLTNIKSGTQVPDDGVFRNTVSFDAQGSEAGIYSLLESFSKTLPLMSIDKVSMSKNADFLLANITLNIYSADLPKKLPSLNSAPSELSKAEIDLLLELSSYFLPAFIEPSSNVGNVESRSDPFGI